LPRTRRGIGRELSKSVVALALAAHSACGPPKDPIQALLNDLEEAAEQRDAEAVVGHLAPDFRGASGVGRAEVSPVLRRYFAACEKVNLSLYDIAIERGEGTARVRFRADFDGRPLQLGGLGGFLPPSAIYRFDLGLRLVEGRWLVSDAEWEELTPRPPGQALS